MTMLGLIVVVIMLGFPTAFTLMGLGMFFGFIAFYDPAQPWFDNHVFDLFVQRAYGAMTNETLLSIPLFVLMGYVMERGALVDKMFYSVQLAFRRVPGSLAAATLIICTFWGIASGLVGAVVVLMGVIAMRPMLNAGYDTRLAAGVITAGGTLGILIPPSVMIIVYAAVAGQSVVKLYAAAMFPGFFLAFLYLVYVVGWAMIQPQVAPKLPPDKQRAEITPWVAHLAAQYSPRLLPALLKALWSPARAMSARIEGLQPGRWLLLRNLVSALAPLLLALVTLGTIWWYVTIYSQRDENAASTAPSAQVSDSRPALGGLAEPPGTESARPSGTGLAEPPGTEEPRRSGGLAEPPGAEAPAQAKAETGLQALGEPVAAQAIEPLPDAFYIGFGLTCAATLLLLAWYYWRMDAEQYEILRMLVSSVMPLGILTLVVLGVILFGITTAT
ncbi:MAG TPA: TRAP transporter large permease subunit, partial [Ideonella sp.]|nr:TRAP transporter large permease subunit [Ideonella sp.]